MSKELPLVEDCVTRNVCTSEAFGHGVVWQKAFYCDTCKGEVCINCLELCHDGSPHLTRPLGKRFVACECGLGRLPKRCENPAKNQKVASGFGKLPADAREWSRMSRDKWPPGLYFLKPEDGMDPADSTAWYIAGKVRAEEKKLGLAKADELMVLGQRVQHVDEEGDFVFAELRFVFFRVRALLPSALVSLGPLRSMFWANDDMGDSCARDFDKKSPMTPIKVLVRTKHHLAALLSYKILSGSYADERTPMGAHILGRRRLGRGGPLVPAAAVDQRVGRRDGRASTSASGRGAHDPAETDACSMQCLLQAV
jgi:hypothetical protein